MLTFLSVLKKPTERHHLWWAAWGPTYLMRMAALRQKYLTVPHRWVVLSDFPPGALTDRMRHHRLELPEFRPLESDAPGWWAKLEMFRHNFGGPVLYSDLDNVLRPGFDEIAKLDPEAFTVLNSRGVPPTDNSGLMLFQGDGRYRYLWDDYRENQRDIHEQYTTWPHASDQAWISERSGIEGDGPLTFFQDRLAGATYSPRYEFESDEDGWKRAGVIIGSYGWKPHQHLDKEMFTDWVVSLGSRP